MFRKLLFHTCVNISNICPICKGLAGPEECFEVVNIFLWVKYFPCWTFSSLASTLSEFNAFFFFPCIQICVGNWTRMWITSDVLRQFLLGAPLLTQEATVYFLWVGTQDSLKTTCLTKVISIKWRRPGLMLVLLHFYLDWAISPLTEIHFPIIWERIF